MSTYKVSKLLDQVRNVLCLKHYTYSTEQEYCSWIIQFDQLLDRNELMPDAEKKIECFLSYLPSYKEWRTINKARVKAVFRLDTIRPILTFN